MHPEPHPIDRAVRILFVFACLDVRDDSDVRLLARYMDPSRYRIDAIACARNDAAGYPLERLTGLDIAVDCDAYDLSFEDTVAYLARKLPGYELVVSCQNVADIYPALERLRHRPPLIERGRTLEDALAGPKHFTCRYAAMTPQGRAAAAGRMSHNPAHAVLIPPMIDLSEAAPEEAPLVDGRRPSVQTTPPHERGAEVDFAVPQWTALIEAVLAEAPKAPAPSLFSTYAMGGFECSTHRLKNGKRLDVIASIGHDIHAEADYRQLQDHGIRNVRDGIRWHLIEQSAGRYDFSSLTPMIEAANRTGTQVIWDVLHYGWPDDVDVWAPSFVDRFTRFVRAVGNHMRQYCDAVPFWCPVNEMSYLSWGGGEVGYLNPFAVNRGFELKCQLARAAIHAIHELRAIDGRARFVQCEPGVAVHHDPAGSYSRTDAEDYHERQFQAFDLLAGRLWPQVGGDETCLDIVGINYYMHNQRFYEGPQIDLDHERYRPLSDILFENYARYGRPILISETGIEGDRRAHWFDYVAGEAARARARGVPVEGICLYPVCNHPGWDDDRLCPNGMLAHRRQDSHRDVHAPLAEALRRLQPDRQPAPVRGQKDQLV
jgi:hypothetical protein